MSGVLVAGMGNVLEGDDGFGVRSLEALREAGGLPAAVSLAEVGIGGMHLVQTLMDGYDALILLDAVDRGGAPGTLYVLEPDVPDPADLGEAERSSFLADMHVTVPAKALLLARAVGVLPPRVYLVGCQPAELELGIELSEPVARAVATACRRVRELAAALAAPPEDEDSPYNRSTTAPSGAERSLR